MSSSNCCFLTCIQISQEAGQVVWYSHLFKDFPQLFFVIQTVKGFGIVNKAEVDVYLEVSEGSNKPCVNQDPESPQRLSVSCEVWISSGLPQGQRAWVQQSGYCISPFGGGCNYSHIRNPRTYTGLGKQTLGRHRQKLVCPRTQEKGTVTPQATDPDLPVSVQESPAEARVGCGLLQDMGPFEGGHCYLHYLHYSWASHNREGTQPHLSTENWIKDLVSMAALI